MEAGPLLTGRLAGLAPDGVVGEDKSGLLGPLCLEHPQRQTSPALWHQSLLWWPEGRPRGRVLAFGVHGCPGMCPEGPARIPSELIPEGLGPQASSSLYWEQDQGQGALWRPWTPGGHGATWKGMSSSPPMPGVTTLSAKRLSILTQGLSEWGAPQC